MLFAHIKNSENGTEIEFPIDIEYLKKEFSNISFPKSMEDFDYSAYSVVSVVEVDKPIIDDHTQKILEVAPENIDGTWYQKWEVIELSDEEREDIIISKAYYVRADRNRLLAESDWTQFNDSPLDEETKTAWATYRRELRGITLQEGFPNNITWPEKP